MLSFKHNILTAAVVVAATVSGGTGVASAHTISSDAAFNNALNSAYNEYLISPTAVDYGVRQCDRINAHDVNCVGRVVYTDRPVCDFTIESFFASDFSDVVSVWESDYCDR